MRIDFELPETLTTPDGETVKVKKLPDELKRLVHLYVVWKNREEEVKAELAMVQTSVNAISSDINKRLSDLKEAVSNDSGGVESGE